MDLLQVRDYVQQHRLVLMSDVANHFRVEVEVIQPMLEFWLRKGKVQRLSGASSCGRGCCGCHQCDIDLYQWIE